MKRKHYCYNQEDLLICSGKLTTFFDLTTFILDFLIDRTIPYNLSNKYVKKPYFYVNIDSDANDSNIHLYICSDMISLDDIQNENDILNILYAHQIGGNIDQVKFYITDYTNIPTNYDNFKKTPLTKKPKIYLVNCSNRDNTWFHYSIISMDINENFFYYCPNYSGQKTFRKQLNMLIKQLTEYYSQDLYLDKIRLYVTSKSLPYEYNKLIQYIPKEFILNSIEKIDEAYIEGIGKCKIKFLYGCLKTSDSCNYQVCLNINGRNLGKYTANKVWLNTRNTKLQGMYLQVDINTCNIAYRYIDHFTNVKAQTLEQHSLDYIRKLYPCPPIECTIHDFIVKKICENLERKFGERLTFLRPNFSVGNVKLDIRCIINKLDYIIEVKPKKLKLNDIYQVISQWDTCVKYGIKIDEIILVVHELNEELLDYVNIKNGQKDILGNNYKVTLKTLNDFELK